LGETCENTNIMKKIITTASLAALGAAGLQAEYAPGLSETERAKPWSIAASVRGFYDDNYATLPTHASPGFPTKRGSWGFDLSPKFSLNLPLERTLIGLDYIYDMRWYADRADNHIASADHSHQIIARLGHEFTEGYRLDLSDSFVIAQEPELLNSAQTPVGTPLRLNGNNIRNTATAKLHADFTRNFGIELGYSNTLIDYDQNSRPIIGGLPAGISYGALLNRMEHLVNLDLRYRALPMTWALIGYQFGLVDHTSKDSFMPPAQYVKNTRSDPSLRDEQSHYVYAGIDQMFTKNINGSLRVGAQYTQWPNHNWPNPDGTPAPSLKKDDVIPYVDASGTYTFGEGNTVQLGVRHSRIQTDIYSLDSEATTLYASLAYRITPVLKGTLLGSYQHSSFQGPLTGTVTGQSEDYYTVGLNFDYSINRFLAAEAGYNFDRLSSELSDRSFSRNRVYFGFRASY